MYDSAKRLQLPIDYYLGEEGTADTLHVPATCPDLAAMTSLLLALTGIDTHVRVTKAKGKDFNEDLATPPTEGGWRK